MIICQYNLPIMKELLYLKDDQLKEFIEKISMSYRETFSDAKKILDKYSIGVAHHKVINLISLYDGITISELLKKLKITKQSLNRVLRDLKRLKLVKQIKDIKDTRRKLLYLDNPGKKFYNEVFEIQKKRIFNALKNSDSESVIKFKEVLQKIINGKK